MDKHRKASILSTHFTVTKAVRFQSERPLTKRTPSVLKELQSLSIEAGFLPNIVTNAADLRS